MIDIKNKVDCCGCNACGDICPKDAISFHIDNEGFWYPEIDMDNCINCHLCEKVCPIINVDKLKQNEYLKPDCYAAINKNIEERFASASGGMYSALADKILKAGGYVAGVTFNGNYSLRFQITNDKKEFKKLRGSKYLQADAQGFYKKIKELLDVGEKVFVCGCPCQMAALRAFLHMDYDNLIIADVICLGINSPMIFQKYLDSLEKRYHSEIVEFYAKNKELGWEELTSKIIFKNGDVLYDTKKTNTYTKGFINTKMFSRPACYDCKFKGYPRISDITIGDFWGVKKHEPSMFDNLGTSVLLLNNSKGKKYFESLQNKLTTKSVALESIEEGNEALVRSLKTKEGFDRDQFYEDLNVMDFTELSNKYIFTSNIINSKRKIKNILRFILSLKHVCGLNLPTLWKNIKYNFFDKRLNVSVPSGIYILICKNCVFNIHKSAQINIKGIFIFGSKGRYPKSKNETHLLMEANSTLNIGGNVTFAVGGDMEVFHDATLEIGDGCITNINPNIICGESIKIGAGTMFGRNVTVRDNNGGHYMSIRGYKNNRSVEIGQHCWLCESSLIMAGSNLGIGVVVSGGSLVSGHIPSFSLVGGNPAKILEKNVFWKY